MLCVAGGAKLPWGELPCREYANGKRGATNSVSDETTEPDDDDDFNWPLVWGSTGNGSRGWNRMEEPQKVNPLSARVPEERLRRN